MELKNIDFSKPLKLLINGEEWECDQNISLHDHVFNYSGSEISLSNVYPKSAKNDITKFIKKLPKFSPIEIYYGDDLFFFGFVKLQKAGSFDPRLPKFFDIKGVTLKELLTHEPMDFPIFRISYKQILDKIIQKLGNPLITIGKVEFENDSLIDSYNTQNKTAYDILRKVETHSNSILEIKMEQDKTLSINFFSKESIKDVNYGNKGVDIVYSNFDNQKAFWERFEIETFEWKDRNDKNSNFVRVESEHVLSSRLRTVLVETILDKREVITPFPVGKVDKLNTFMYAKNDPTKKPIRPLVIINQTQADQGMAWDIVFNPNSNDIKLNDRLFPPSTDNIVQIAYLPLLRQSFDFNNIHDQNDVKKLTNGSGKIMRYEKFNDHSTTKDLITIGSRLVSISSEDKTSLLITSHKPIWNLGEETNFIASEEFKDFESNYIVREIDVKINEDFFTFQYVLVKTIDLENEYNFYDSQNYRDNPIVDTSDVIINNNITLTEHFQVVFNFPIISCGIRKPIGDASFDYNLDISFDDEIDNVPFRKLVLND